MVIKQHQILTVGKRSSYCRFSRLNCECQISVLEYSKILVVEAANECSTKCLKALKYGSQKELELFSQELSKLNAVIDVIDNKLEALSISY